MPSSTGVAPSGEFGWIYAGVWFHAAPDLQTHSEPWIEIGEEFCDAHSFEHSHAPPVDQTHRYTAWGSLHIGILTRRSGYRQQNAERPGQLRTRLPGCIPMVPG